MRSHRITRLFQVSGTAWLCTAVLSIVITVRYYKFVDRQGFIYTSYIVAAIPLISLVLLGRMFPTFFGWWPLKTKQYLLVTLCYTLVWTLSVNMSCELFNQREIFHSQILTFKRFLEALKEHYMFGAPVAFVNKDSYTHAFIIITYL